MEKIARDFEKEYGVPVRLIIHGSGTLLSQMELSRKGDIYLPGSPDYIIIGERKELLVPASDRIVVYLVPAIIVPRGNPAGIRSLEDLARPGVRVGIGNPETVCLGLYAVELLDKNGLLEKVLPNVVTCAESCEKTANLAALKQVDAVIGWSVFQDWNPERIERILIPPERIPRLSYVPVSLPVFARDPARSRRFIDYLLSPPGLDAFRGYGYITAREEALRFAPQAGIGGEYRLPEKYFDLIRKK
jgi:molybdate transport system substrate-binding protein